MKNKNLYDLNFNQLLGYSDKIESTHKGPFKCNSYCISCEEKGLCDNIEGELFQMSHGADTFDFEACLGSIDENSQNLHPIMFILESPGGDYGNGEPITYKAVKKYPPINVYYWIADHLKNLGHWPEESDLSTDLYGPYFAYLINKFKLKNVYITNLVKCSRKKTTDASFSFLDQDDKNEKKLINNCSSLYLQNEINIHKPLSVFLFGDRVTDCFTNLNLTFDYSFPWANGNPYVRKLYHPSARISSKTFIDSNNSVIEKTIKEMALNLQ